MKATMKSLAKPYAVLFAVALVIAILGRIGLGIAASMGILAFDYISASDVPILDVICSILTGSAFVGFLFAAGLALSLSTAGPVLGAALFARGEKGAKRPLVAFLWGWATALVAIICLVILALGILSAVQVGSMSSKLPGMAVIVLGVIVFAAFLGTLLAAAQMVLIACLERAENGKALARNLILACLGCGAVVMVLTLGTFGALNQSPIPTGTLLAWVAADLIVNVALLLGAHRVAAKPAASSSVATSVTPAGKTA